MSVSVSEYTMHYWYCYECDATEEYDNESAAREAAREHECSGQANEEDDE